MTPQTYYWVVGLRRGSPVLDGPHSDEQEAQAIADDLTGAEVHSLTTRNHQRAKQLLAGRGAFDREKRNRLHADEPPEENGETVMDRIRRFLPQRKPKDEEEEF